MEQKMDGIPLQITTSKPKIQLTKKLAILRSLIIVLMCEAMSSRIYEFNKGKHFVYVVINFS